jgi:cytoskeletal protein CcmA (bactofilin family)
MFKFFFRRRGALRATGLPNVVAAETEIRGDLRSPQGFRIEGRVVGSVHSDGTVIVGESGSIRGGLRADAVQVLGHVDGEIVAVGHIEVGSRGVLEGEVTMKSLHVEAGGVFRGRSRMHGEPAQLTTGDAQIRALPGRVECTDRWPGARALGAQGSSGAATPSPPDVQHTDRPRTLPPPAGGAVPPPRSEMRPAALPVAEAHGPALPPAPAVPKEFESAHERATLAAEDVTDDASLVEAEQTDARATGTR